MIIDMVRVRLMGPRERIGDVVDVLQDAGVFQPAGVRSSGVEELPGSSERDRRARQLQQVLEDVNHVLSAFPAAAVPEITGPEADADVERLAEWAKLARRSRRELERIEDERGSLREERDLLARHRRFHEAFRRMLGREEGPSRLRTYPLVLDSTDAVAGLREGLDEILGDEYELRTEPLEEGEVVALLLVPAGRSSRVEELMGKAGVRELPAPPGVESRTLAEAVPAIYERLVDIDEREREIDVRLRTMAEERASELATARATIRDRLVELDAMDRVATTHHAFILEGWVPEEEMAELESRLGAAFGGALVVERIAREAWEEAEAPVVLRNPRLFRPFEAITRLMPLPRYGSIDPTPFVAVFFPAFFGLILGDVGYGLLLGGLALLLHHRSSEGTTLRSVAEIAGACGVFSIVFGFLYGEAFGDFGHRVFGLEPLVFDREEALVPFLALAVAIGFVHMVLGLVLGMTASIRHHESREAVGRGISALMVVLVAIALLAAVKILPAAFFSPVVIGLLIAFPILVIAEGFLAPLELLSTLGNVLSYARIMALGTASVMMAVVANRMVGATGSVLVGVMFALLFHTVNFALGVFGPTVHGLRLHYVEFFGKFYDPGGGTYRPLRHWEEAPEGPGGPSEKTNTEGTQETVSHT